MPRRSDEGGGREPSHALGGRSTRGAGVNALNARLPAGLSRPAGGGRAGRHWCGRVRHPGSNGTASLVSPGWTHQRHWCGPGHHCPSGPWRCANHRPKRQRPTTRRKAGTVDVGVAFPHLGPHTLPTTGLRARVVGGSSHLTVSRPSCPPSSCQVVTASPCSRRNSCTSSRAPSVPCRSSWANSSGSCPTTMH